MTKQSQDIMAEFEKEFFNDVEAWIDGPKSKNCHVYYRDLKNWLPKQIDRLKVEAKISVLEKWERKLTLEAGEYPDMSIIRYILDMRSELHKLNEQLKRGQ